MHFLEPPFQILYFVRNIIFYGHLEKFLWFCLAKNPMEKLIWFGWKKLLGYVRKIMLSGKYYHDFVRYII